MQIELKSVQCRTRCVGVQADGVHEDVPYLPIFVTNASMIAMIAIIRAEGPTKKRPRCLEGNARL